MKLTAAQTQALALLRTGDLRPYRRGWGRFTASFDFVCCERSTIEALARRGLVRILSVSQPSNSRARLTWRGERMIAS